MNTKLISNTRTKSVPNFPTLTADKRNRIITKHFTNLAMYMDKSELSLLSWLIYQSSVDNVFIYSSKLLRCYRQSIIESNKEYNGVNEIKTALSSSRHYLKNLIERGYVFNLGKENKYLINPLLTFHPSLKKEYTNLSKDYLKLSNELKQGLEIKITSKLKSEVADK